jgi:DNA-binding LacI/PurR family transcriptional regulator
MVLTGEPRRLGTDRREQLLTLLSEHGRLRVADLAAHLDVTTMTIRRDLTALEAEGMIIRVHGGAALAPGALLATASPNAPARRGHFGMLVPGLDFYWPEVARGAEAAARRLGVRLSLRRGSYDSPDERPSLKRLAEAEDVLGLLVAPNMGGPRADAVIDWLVGCGLPWVLVEREAQYGARGRPVESVTSDHAWGARLAVMYLWELGHRRIGLVTSETSPTTTKILHGWERARHDLNLSDGCFAETIIDHRQSTFGRLAEEVVDRTLAEGATALFVHSDREAMSLIQHFETRGLDIPGDISIITYDDEVAALFNPPLTAVRPARWALGEAAAKLLWARIEDPTGPVHRMVINPELYIRESTAPPRP